MKYHPFYVSAKGGTIQYIEGDRGRLFRVCSRSQCLYCEGLHSAKSHLDYLERSKGLPAMLLPPSSPLQPDELWPYPPLALLMDTATNVLMENDSASPSGLTENTKSNHEFSLEAEQTWDAVETYFECISTCSLDDGECLTSCVEQLREAEE